MIFYSLLLITLVGCGSNARAPVEDRHVRGAPANTAQGQYTVQRGDTLYSIAFRYGLDFRRMAAANGINSPYTIYPGQKIQLREAAVVNRSSTASPSSSVHASGAASSKTVKARPPVTKPASSSAKKSTANKSVPASTSKSVAGGTVKSWRWPSSGKVIRGYSSSVHKGIDLSGKRGDAVIASAAGQVVYAGTGIVGLGELIIIKHSEVYLSAYGHNDRLLVKEGETIKAGQKIALKGDSGTDIVKLHFEIRKEGKPIDPQRLLPRR